MPKGKEYNRKNVGMGASRTPASVMGSQGKPAHIKAEHFMNRPTGSTPFPGDKASGRGNAPNHRVKKDY